MNINPKRLYSENSGNRIQDYNQLADALDDLLQRQANRLPAEVQEFLGEFSWQLSTLNKQAFRLTEERDNLSALTQIGQVVNSSLELDEVLRIVMDTLVRLIGAERGFLMLRNARGEFHIQVARNWEQEAVDPSEFAISRTVIQRVVNEGQPVLTTNAQEDPRFGGQESIIRNNLRSILCVPLKVKGVLTGVIYADNRIHSGIFSETDRNLLAAFANQAAVAVENARLFASVRQTLGEVTELKYLTDNVFASIASGVITIDAHERIMLANRTAQSLLGSAEVSLIGKPLSVCAPGLAQALSPYLRSVRQSQQPQVGLEVNTQINSRGPVALRLNLSPLKDGAQGIVIVLEDLTEKKRLEAQHRLFERMVSPAVIEQLNPDQLALGGKRTQITTLFADIRGFTSFSDNRDPDELVSILNCYLAAAAEAVLSEEGTIDKFMGDAIMAWFNAPIQQADHTLRAVRTALAIRKAVDSLKDKLPQPYHLSFGIGIHYGEAVLGLVGTEKRLEYTAIGDSINTAKRIQENAGPGSILISDDAYAQVGTAVLARPAQPITAKGKRQVLKVYEVLGLR